MERSSKRSPRRDDQDEHETQGMVRAGRSTRTEESVDPEPSAEDQPDVDRVPDRTRVGGTPPGTNARAVDERAEIARHLGKEIWPAGREAVVEQARQQNAPDSVLDQLQGLPDRTYENVNDVVGELGLDVETGRT